MTHRMRNFILIGHPVGHSLSPAIHRAAYAQLGVDDCEYSTRDCPDAASVERAFADLKEGRLAGANVTVPWKRLALDLADVVDGSAESTGAANVLVPTRSVDGRTVVTAHNTDVPALAAELGAGCAAPGAALVIGNGGAALAAVSAVRLLKTPNVYVLARKFRGEPSGWEHAAAFRALGATPVAWPVEPASTSALGELARRLDVIVQTTSDGMSGATDGRTVRDVVPWDAISKRAFVYDVVYNPAITPFVEAARAAGLRAESGLGMLVGQAVLAIELWLGRRPEAAALRRAAERALLERASR